MNSEVLGEDEVEGSEETVSRQEEKKVLALPLGAAKIIAAQEEPG